MGENKDGEQQCSTHLIEVLRVNLPEAAGGWLTELTGPAQAWPRAGVGPGSVSWEELWAWRRTTGRPAEMRGRGLAQSLLGWSWTGAGIDSVTGYLGVVEVLLSLGLVWPTAVHVWQGHTSGHTSGHTEKKSELCVCRVSESSTYYGPDWKAPFP